MTYADQHDVLVVGAGPTGLVAATELARRGTRVRIVDKAAAPIPIEQSRALGVQAPTMEIFERLGLAEVLATAGEIINTVAVYGRHGRGPREISLDALDVPYPFILSIEQGKIERALEENLAQHEVKVERSVELVDLRQHCDGVRAVLRAVDGVEEELQTRYLIGCDGARSAVRSLIGAKWPDGRFGDRYALADARIDWHRDPPADAQMQMYLSPKGVLILGRMPEGRWRVIVSFPPRHPWDGEPTLSAIQHQVDVHAEAGARLYDPSWLSTYRYTFSMVDRLRFGRVLLAGDAAHVHSPVGAQGMNTGIQDAFNLGWKLALRLQGIGGEPLLDSYHSERRPVIADLLRTTKAQELLMEAHQPLVAQSRDDLLSVLTACKVLRQPLSGKFSRSSTSYSGSPIVGECKQTLRQRLQAAVMGAPYPSMREGREFGGGPKAGARAPDAEGLVDAAGHGPKRLHQVLSEDERHHLIIFCGASARARRPGELARLGDRVADRYRALIRPLLVSTVPDESHWALLDARGTVHDRYGAGFECLYLVRPDGYIAFRAQPVHAHALEEFLRGALRITHARGAHMHRMPVQPKNPAVRRRENPTLLS